MSLLEDTIAKIQPPSAEAVEHIRSKLDRTVGDETGLGGLKELLLKYAGITLSDHPEPPKKATIICCADHGVAEMKVSAYPPSTTVQMTENYLISRGAVANALSNFAGSELLVADLGIAAPTDQLPGLIHKKIALGTKNCAAGPAMTREQAIQSIETGIELATECAEKGTCCFSIKAICFSNFCGNHKSSLSRKAMYFPLARLMPSVRATAGPPFCGKR